MKHGPYKGRTELYELATKLRMDGLGYGTIAKQIGGGISAGTVRNWTRGVKSDHIVAQLLGNKRRRRKPLELCRKKESRKRIVIVERGHKCEVCSLTEWRGQPIPLELHHVDGDKHNNERRNLMLLCPNCHAFTETYRGKNIAVLAQRKRQIS
jgi:hypothetical protein